MHTLEHPPNCKCCQLARTSFFKQYKKKCCSEYFKIIIAVFTIPLPAKLYHLGDDVHSEMLQGIYYICS